ncbi:MAG TPA: FixH family protein, partial [Bacteroidia bacterium]|nr:FixH family protein [Bacteroidia bacterium]
MKINWGWGIVIFLIVFMTFILQFVYRCTQQRVDLVSEKYYENEIKYQQRIEMNKNTAALDTALRISLNQGKVAIEYPSAKGARSGNITFFKPDDSRQDKIVAIDSTSGSTKQLVDVANLKKGWWNVQVQWS